MRIYLLRHGTAIEREEAQAKGISDPDRSLVARGREKNLKMLQWFKSQGIQFDAMLVSPYKRAQQTAEQLRPLLVGAHHPNLVELIPSAPVSAFAQWLKSIHKNYTSMLVVGHEPMLSSFASWLCSGSQESFIDLKKSGCICLEIESLSDLNARSAELKWIVSPKQLG